ncbi:universal stress protein UspA [Halorientalis sp. IM1011]|uniref:HPP family protein n=1 Tax=Halorientalis sp. IM1011 TaxID=1932360 RepID=UPI00097CC77A|nr:HPP family protein [Halorientalis sp. IM1011]AQL43480.1 universal stress protein UspA [Halorientalis sp. IM1011]
MRDRLRERVGAARARLARFERRELWTIRRWLENTRNLVHLSVLVFVPLLIAAVTWISNAVSVLPFLLFPPLASGTYMLFARPESEYASPTRFVGGLTVGAFCGWLAYVLSTVLWAPPGRSTVDPGAAAFSIFLTGLVTWLLSVEEASAYSSALLIHVIDVSSANSITLDVLAGLSVTLTPRLAYVGSVLASSTLVAGVFLLWRETFYEERARYLYQSTKGDDHVLVPMRTDDADATAMLAANLAAAHEAGKVVLLDVVDDEAVAAAERELLEGTSQVRTDGGPASDASDGGLPDDGGDLDAETLDEMAENRVASNAADRLERQAARIETKVGVPCEVVVASAGGSPAATVLSTAHATNCDLIATPYEQRHGGLSPFVRLLFRGDVDVLVHRSCDGRTRWNRVLVPVRRAGDVAHAMIDFALRLTGRSGHVGVAHCLHGDGDRRRAENMLADLVAPFDGSFETRISRMSIEDFLDETAPNYELVFMGASMDRSRASRLVSPPTFERIRDLDCDVAIVDRNR